MVQSASGPRAYYAAYFTGRGEDFDAEPVSKGKSGVKLLMDNLRAKGKEATAKEQSQAETLHVIYESMQRGIEYLPVDLYKSHSYKSCWRTGRTGCRSAPSRALAGRRHQSLMEAREAGPYISCDDLQNRSGITKAVVESLRLLGVLDAPARDQSNESV